MKEPDISKDLESILGRIKLKRPSENLMQNFNLQVDQKINSSLQTSSGFQISGVLGIFAVVALLSGLYFAYQWYQSIPDVREHPTSIVKSNDVAAIKKEPNRVGDLAKNTNIEEELALLESLDPEFEDELLDLFEDEALLEEFSAFDDTEFAAAGLQTSMSR